MGSSSNVPRAIQRSYILRTTVGEHLASAAMSEYDFPISTFRTMRALIASEKPWFGVRFAHRTDKMSSVWAMIGYV